MSFTVKDKVVVITGAGAGIGRGTAELFAKHGAKVVVTDVNLKGVEETAASITAAGGEALSLKHDVASEEQWVSVLKQAKERFGGIDVLINNAGIYIIAPLAETTLEQWNRLMSINVTGVFLGAKHVAPYLEERKGGSIVNLSSIAGLEGIPGHTLYGASKGAVRIMTKDLAAELGPKNIRVNSVHPTYVATEMLDYAVKIYGVSADKLGKKLSPLGHLADVADIANMIVFLCSEESNYLTGTEYTVDGGGTSVMMPG